MKLNEIVETINSIITINDLQGINVRNPSYKKSKKDFVLAE